MNKQEFLKTIPTLKEGYFIYSQLTRSPYVECDEETFDDKAYFFTKKEAADQKIIELNKLQKNVASVKISQNVMLGNLTTLFIFNINALVLSDGKDTFQIQLTELLKRPDYSGLAEEKRPIENPGMQLAMLYFMQAIRSPEKEKDMAHIKELEEEMVVNLTRGRYLLPFKEVEKDGQKVQQIIFTKLKDEKFYIPVFTDSMEFQRFLGAQKDLKCNILNFETMVKMKLPEQASGFIMNPAGAAAVFPDNYIKKIGGNMTIVKK